jgi:hypothetical protein
MKLVSKFALAFVMGSVAFAPSAYAQKNKKDNKEAGIVEGFSSSLRSCG